jgi:hypothetical protein
MSGPKGTWANQPECPLWVISGRALGPLYVRFAPTSRHFQFAVSAMSFPVWNKKFPVLIAGNSSKEVPFFNGF